MKKAHKSLVLLLAVVFVLTACVIAACAGKVTMTFVTNGGTEIASIKAKAGDDITPPGDPTRDGYVFDGWYLNEDLSGDRQTIPSKMPEKNVTYYAKWVVGAQVTLTLDPASGGTLAEKTYTIAAGTKLSAFLKDIVPTTETGLEFAGWYNGNKAISDADTMPNRNLTLKAKYYANYTVNVYEQALDGSYPSTAQSTKQKAFYGEAFTYEVTKEHFRVDLDCDNKLTSASLGKNETFTVYLARDKYGVYYTNPLNSDDFEYEEILYGNKLQIAGGIFHIEGLRFAAWTQTGDESDAKGVYFFAGDELLIDKDYYLYAQWDTAFYDMFGGSDYVFIPHLQEGVAVLDRWGVGEKLGSYDKTTNVFAFKGDDSNEILGGKIVGDAFYYYRDSIEKVYADYNKSSATLEMKANGSVIYTDAQNVKTTGVYDVNEEGFYLFISDTLNFVYRLESLDDDNTVRFRMQGDEVGYYVPAASEIKDGVVLYYLNGFGEGLELYDESNPYNQNGVTLTEIPLVYDVIDKGENFVTYTLYSIVIENDSLSHMFDFRIVSGSGMVDDRQTKGSMLRGDGFTGKYNPNNVDGNSTEGQTLYLDGFGKGTYGNKAITYNAHTETFLLSDYASNGILLLADYWVNFTIVGESAEYKIRPRRSSENSDNLYYDWIEGELFGTYEFEDGIVVNGETLKAIIYIFAGYSEAAQMENCAILLVQTDEYEGYPLWKLYDYNSDTPLQSDDNGVYTLSGKGTRFVINANKNAEFVPEKQVEIEFFNDNRGTLIIDEDGIATYTPAGGDAHTVNYVKELGYGYVLYAVYTFDLDGTQYVFVYYVNNGEMVVGEATVLSLDSSQASQSDTPVRIVLYNETEGVYSAAVGLLIDNDYYYAIEGAVNVQSDGIHHFKCSEYDIYEDIPDYLLNFRYTTQGKTFTIAAKVLELRNEDEGLTLVMDGFGNATITEDNKTPTECIYEVYFSYNDNVVLYSLIRGFYYWLITVDEEQATFQFAADEAGRYNDGILYNKFYQGEASYFNYIVLDGEGVAYYVDMSTDSAKIYVGDYVKTATTTVDEYAITVSYDNGDPLSLNVALVSNLYFAKDSSQEADYQIEGGGTLHGDGYGFCDELQAFISLATYVDADGVTYQGILQVGEYANDNYTDREFTPATSPDTRKVVLFSVYVQHGDRLYFVTDIFFDLVTIDGTTVARVRPYQSGAYRLVDEGKTSEATIYLDGHGNATLYDADGSVSGNGKYEMATDIDEYTYRYIGDDNQTNFLFKLYLTQESDGYVYEYAIFNSSKGEFVSDKWAYLSLDGYINAIYVDKYGVIYTGRYGFVNEKVIAVYFKDGTTLYFELIDDNTFRVVSADSISGIGATMLTSIVDEKPYK